MYIHIHMFRSKLEGSMQKSSIEIVKKLFNNWKRKIWLSSLLWKDYDIIIIKKIIKKLLLLNKDMLCK